MTVNQKKTPAAGAMTTAIILLLATIFFCWAQLKIMTPNHDVTWLIAMSRQIIEGGKYYKDFYELNPPLYMILIIPIHYFSDLTGIAPYPSFIFTISALVYAVSVICNQQLSAILSMNWIGKLVLAVCFEAALFFLPGADFGQRDPVAVILMLPAIFWLAARLPGEQLTIRTALFVAMAGIGFLIKPYLVCVGLCVYALRLGLTRDVRILVDPAILILTALALIYTCVIWFLFPEWIMMAHIAGSFYGAYDAPSWLTDPAKVAIAALIVLTVLNEFLQESARTKQLCRYMAAAATGALLSYIIQHKGFDYHFIPAKTLISFLFALTILGAFRVIRGFPGGVFLYEQRGLVTGFALALVLLRVVDWTAFEARRREAFLNQFMVSMANLDVGKKIYFLSTSMYPQYPLNIYDSTLHTSRFPCLWTLPAIMKRDQENGLAEAALSQDDKDLIALVREDFDRWSPDTVIVDDSPRHQALPGRFDFLAWFRRDPQMAQMLNQYQFVGRFHGGSKLAVFETDFAIYRKPAICQSSIQ